MSPLRSGPGTAGGRGGGGSWPLQLWQSFSISRMALHEKNESKIVIVLPTMEAFPNPCRFVGKCANPISQCNYYYRKDYFISIIIISDTPTCWHVDNISRQDVLQAFKTRWLHFIHGTSLIIKVRPRRDAERRVKANFHSLDSDHEYINY